MTKSTDNVLAEIKELRDQLNRLEVKLEEIEEQPKAFEVVLKVTTRPSTWGYDHVDNVEMRNHFNDFMYEMKEALRLDDDGDEIEVVNVTEVT